MSADLLKLNGANMDIDLTSSGEVAWSQQPCPWNAAEGSNEHKCAVKNISICPYFCGIEYLDTVICCYPNENQYRPSA
jgi:hypothetical protein